MYILENTFLCPLQELNHIYNLENHILVSSPGIQTHLHHTMSSSEDDFVNSAVRGC